jgi:hypothetical protein
MKVAYKTAISEHTTEELEALYGPVRAQSDNVTLFNCVTDPNPPAINRIIQACGQPITVTKPNEGERCAFSEDEVYEFQRGDWILLGETPEEDESSAPNEPDVPLIDKITVNLAEIGHINLPTSMYLEQLTEYERTGLEANPLLEVVSEEGDTLIRKKVDNGDEGGLESPELELPGLDNND